MMINSKQAGQRYRVDLGYGEIGSGENFPLGTWEGAAESDADAQQQAYDDLWDDRLNAASCAPRYAVQRVATNAH